jgi:hypothetical protein
MMNSCWSTSTTIYIEPCGKPKPTTTVASTPISNAKAPISAWYNINETVSWNYEYACNHGIDVKKHSLYNYVYRQRKYSEKRG